jgi:hypothetical protein
VVKGPEASGLTMSGAIEGTIVIFISISTYNLINSRQEETNLTSKFRNQGPNTSKRIMAAIGPRKGGTML